MNSAVDSILQVDRLTKTMESKPSWYWLRQIDVNSSSKQCSTSEAFKSVEYIDTKRVEYNMSDTLMKGKRLI